jgi:hypothetical protein
VLAFGHLDIEEQQKIERKPNTVIRPNLAEFDQVNWSFNSNSADLAFTYCSYHEKGIFLATDRSWDRWKLFSPQSWGTKNLAHQNFILLRYVSWRAPSSESRVVRYGPYILPRQRYAGALAGPGGGAVRCLIDAVGGAVGGVSQPTRAPTSGRYLSRCAHVSMPASWPGCIPPTARRTLP